MKSAGFKEWALVCEALGRGEQTVLVRKGGIAEGRDGFSFREREFYLFPTFFHEQLEKTRLAAGSLPPSREAEIEIRYFAKMERSKVVTRWEDAERLRPFHILRDEVIRQRFDYDDAPGLHVAFVRVFRVTPAWFIPNSKAYGGCRSWVSLPEENESRTLSPVLTDAAHAEWSAKFDAVVSATAANLQS